MEEKLYYVYTRGNIDSAGNILWWKPEGMGYTVDIEEAGLHTKDEWRKWSDIGSIYKVTVPLEIARRYGKRVVTVNAWLLPDQYQ